jgi:hypothetical protein
MRISPNDVKLITEKYKKVNENLGLGPTMSGVGTVGGGLNVVTAVGNAASRENFNKLASAVHGGEVPGGDRIADESEESALPMAKGNINNLVHRAQMLQELIQHESEIEPWIAAKITLATDYVETIVNYLKFRDEGGFEHEIGVNIIDLETRE